MTNNNDEFRITFDPQEMGRQTDRIAAESGVPDKGPYRDRFRHMYTSYKVQEAIKKQVDRAIERQLPVVLAGKVADKTTREGIETVKRKISKEVADKATATLGWGVETARDIRDKNSTRSRNYDGDPNTKWQGNPTTEKQEDFRSNRIGQDLEHELSDQRLSAEEKERIMRQRFAEMVKDESLYKETPTAPTPQPEQPTDPASYVGNNPGLPAGRKPLAEILNFIQRR